MNEPKPPGLHDIAPREIENHLIGRLQGVRSGLQNSVRRFQRLDVIAKVNDVERRPLGFRDEAHLRFHNTSQRSLGTDNHVGKIERLPLDKLIQVIAGDAAQNLRITRQDFLSIFLRKSLNLAVGSGFRAVTLSLPGPFFRREIFERNFAAV